MFHPELYVWEVSTYEIEWVDKETEEYTTGSTIECTYLCSSDMEHSDEFYQKVIEEADIPTENCLVQVYCARTASLYLTKKNTVEIGEVDCSTGYSGSPVYEQLNP